MIVAAFVLLVVAAAAFGYRLCVGPSLADRAIALNGLILVGMGAIAALSIETHDGAFLPTLVALALVASIGTGMVARYIERDGRDG